MPDVRISQTLDKVELLDPDEKRLFKSLFSLYLNPFKKNIISLYTSRRIIENYMIKLFKDIFIKLIELKNTGNSNIEREIRKYHGKFSKELYNIMATEFKINMMNHKFKDKLEQAIESGDKKNIKDIIEDLITSITKITKDSLKNSINYEKVHGLGIDDISLKAIDIVGDRLLSKLDVLSSNYKYKIITNIDKESKIIFGLPLLSRHGFEFHIIQFIVILVLTSMVHTSIEMIILRMFFSKDTINKYGSFTKLFFYGTIWSPVYFKILLNIVKISLKNDENKVKTIMGALLIICLLTLRIISVVIYIKILKAIFRDAKLRKIITLYT